uniref:Uncharacterized protein n=1 Tax=Elaeophora elaphi TaxID=1147741 RepID=A0A0R3RUA6_9BILA
MALIDPIANVFILLNIPSDAREIDLKSAIVDIAYEYWRPKDNKKTHKWCNQLSFEDDMLKWIEIIRIASSTLINSQSDHGTISAGLAKNAKISSNILSNWSTAAKLGSDDSLKIIHGLL